jgi:hypothetical protein
MDAPKRALTLKECAEELNLRSVGVLMNAIRAGRLVALVLSPNADSRKPGPKLYRIEAAERERFKKSIRTRAASPEPPEEPACYRARRGRPKKGAGKPTG